MHFDFEIPSLDAKVLSPEHSETLTVFLRMQGRVNDPHRNRAKDTNRAQTIGAPPRG